MCIVHDSHRRGLGEPYEEKPPILLDHVVLLNVVRPGHRLPVVDGETDPERPEDPETDVYSIRPSRSLDYGVTLFGSWSLTIFNPIFKRSEESETNSTDTSAKDDKGSSGVVLIRGNGYLH